MTIEYHKPGALAEAIQMLQDAGEDARVIAGGQSLMPMINLGLAAPTAVIDVSGLPEMQGIAVQGGHVLIGGGTLHRDLIASSVICDRLPMLSDAASHIGSSRIRNLGTLGGSLAHADPAAELPLACMCLEAEYELTGPEGNRWSRAEDFSLGYYTTGIQEAEVLTTVRIPVPQGQGWGFEEYTRRAGDFAVAAAAATVAVNDGVITRVRVVVAGATDRPLRLTELEEALLDAPLDRVEAVADLAASLVDPSPDPYVDAGYRRRLLGGLTQRALKRAVARAEGGE